MATETSNSPNKEPEKGCFSCRHHSKEERRRPTGHVDGEYEKAEFYEESDPEDEIQVWAICQHSSRNGKEVGPLEMNPGADCDLYEPGSKGVLSPELERLVSISNRTPREED